AFCVIESRTRHAHAHDHDYAYDHDHAYDHETWGVYVGPVLAEALPALPSGHAPPPRRARARASGLLPPAASPGFPRVAGGTGRGRVTGSRRSWSAWSPCAPGRRRG